MDKIMKSFYHVFEYIHSYMYIFYICHVAIRLFIPQKTKISFFVYVFCFSLLLFSSFFSFVFSVLW